MSRIRIDNYACMLAVIVIIKLYQSTEMSALHISQRYFWTPFCCCGSHHCFWAGWDLFPAVSNPTVCDATLGLSWFGTCKLFHCCEVPQPASDIAIFHVSNFAAHSSKELQEMAAHLHAHVDPLTKLSETKKSQTEAIKNEKGKVWGSMC